MTLAEFVDSATTWPVVVVVPSGVALAALTGVGVWWRRHRRKGQ